MLAGCRKQQFKTAGTIFNGWSCPLNLDLTGSFADSVGDELV